MYMNNADSSFGEKETDKLTDEFLIISDNGVEIKVKEYEEKDKKVKRYEAEFEYAGAQYEIKGVVEKEEFEKILKNQLTNIGLFDKITKSLIQTAIFN